MKFFTKAFFVLLTVLMIFSCASANMAMNSARRKADRHEYRDAIEKTLQAMEDAEGDEIAQAEALLQSIVAEGETYHVGLAEAAVGSTEKYHFDQAWPEYRTLVSMRNTLVNAGRDGMLKDYTAQMDETMLLAAREYYDDGMELFEAFKANPNRYLAKEVVKTLNGAYYIFENGNSELPGMADAYNAALDVAKLKVVLIYGDSIERAGNKFANSAINAVGSVGNNDGFIEVKDGLMIEGAFISWLDDNSQYRIGDVTSLSVTAEGFKEYARTVDADIVVYMDVTSFEVVPTERSTSVHGTVKNEEGEMVDVSGTRNEYIRSVDSSLNLYIFDASENRFSALDAGDLPSGVSNKIYHTMYSCDDYTGAIYTGDTEGLNVESTNPHDEIYAQFIRSLTHGSEENQSPEFTESERAIVTEWEGSVEGKLAYDYGNLLNEFVAEQFKQFLSQY
ncbi:MAG: hypothetical protein PF447_06410 [Spirochaetaceae bacterium]|nr:hypothetical protein [Spirochaetaceae bacterium]